MIIYQFPIYLAFPNTFQSRFVSRLAILQKFMQDLMCNFNCVINKLRKLWVSYNVSTDNTKSINEKTDWYKIGNVINLYTYPLFAGNEKEISKYYLTQTGIIEMDEDSTLRNHMFIVYNSETKHIIHDYDNFIMRAIRIVSIDDNKVIIKSSCMYYAIVLYLNKISTKKSAIIRCTTSFCNQFLTYINCIDCGSETANWISSCLKNNNLRLGYTVPETSSVPFQNYIQQIIKNKEDERDFVVPSSCLPVCTLIPSSLHGLISNKLAGATNSQSFQPNIVISTNSLHDLIEWEWVKIGNTILRNIRPWQKVKENIDARNIPLNMILQLLPLQFSLYHSGQMQVGDEVYVKISQKRQERQQGQK